MSHYEDSILQSEESCKVSSSNLIEVSVTFVTSVMCTGSNLNCLSAEWPVRQAAYLEGELR